MRWFAVGALLALFMWATLSCSLGPELDTTSTARLRDLPTGWLIDSDWLERSGVLGLANAIPVRRRENSSVWVAAWPGGAVTWHRTRPPAPDPLALEPRPNVVYAVPHYTVSARRTNAVLWVDRHPNGLMLEVE